MKFFVATGGAQMAIDADTAKDAAAVALRLFIGRREPLGLLMTVSRCCFQFPFEHADNRHDDDMLVIVEMFAPAIGIDLATAFRKN